MCLSCHNGNEANGIPDVYGTSGDTYAREAGALTGTGGLPVPGANYDDYDGHTIGADATSPPGAPGGYGDDTGVLDCIDCHNPHGDTKGGVELDGATPILDGDAYRNLNTWAGTDVADVAPINNFNVTYDLNDTGNDTTRDVYVDVPVATAISGPLSGYYATGIVNFNEPSITQSAMGEFCGKCHDDFHGAVGDVNIGGNAGDSTVGGFLRHPTAGVNIGGGGAVAEGPRNTGAAGITPYAGNALKVMDPLGVWGVPDFDETPTCTTCHKAHGNRNVFGLVFGSLGTGTNAEGEDGTGAAAEDMCNVCHGR